MSIHFNDYLTGSSGDVNLKVNGITLGTGYGSGDFSITTGVASYEDIPVAITAYVIDNPNGYYEFIELNETPYGKCFKINQDQANLHTYAVSSNMDLDTNYAYRLSFTVQYFKPMSEIGYYTDGTCPQHPTSDELEYVYYGYEIADQMIYEPVGFRTYSEAQALNHLKSKGLLLSDTFSSHERFGGHDNKRVDFRNGSASEYYSNIDNVAVLPNQNVDVNLVLLDGTVIERLGSIDFNGNVNTYNMSYTGSGDHIAAFSDSSKARTNMKVRVNGNIYYI